MKYCRKCGKIYAESYKGYDNDLCIQESFPLIEDPDMTEDKFLKLTEEGKDAYELHIIDLCKQSGHFDENRCLRGKTEKDYIYYYDYYYAFRYDKYEQLSGRKAPIKRIKRDLTPDEKAIEEWEARQRIYDSPFFARSSNDANQPKCPTCGSTNINRISTASKFTGATLFGLFSKTAKSQFQCGSCGYKW